MKTAVAGMALNLIAVFGIVSAMLFLGERPGLPSICSGIVIIGCVAGVAVIGSWKAGRCPSDKVDVDSLRDGPPRNR
jgi:drug/metabolite transporter (DMT)-like permease